MKYKMKLNSGLVFLLPIVFLFQNCGSFKSDAQILDGTNIDPLTCNPQTPSLVSHLQGEKILELDLFSYDQGRQENMEALWEVRTEAGALLRESSQTEERLASTYSLNIGSLTPCKVVVTAYYQNCNQTQSLQKTVQLRNCPGQPLPPTDDVPSTTTTVPATHPVPPIAVGGPEIAPGCRRSTAHQVTALWNQVFRFWPAYGRRPRLNIPSDTTQSYLFTTPVSTGSISSNDPGYGVIAVSDFPGDGDGFLKITISQTEGCTDDAKLDPRCSVVVRWGGVAWSLNAPSAYQCPLQHGKSYYVNFTYGTATTPSEGQPYCESGNCGADIQNQMQ